MDKAKFNSRMARPKFSKGGYIKKIGNRKYFDTGGIAQNAPDPGAVQAGGTNTNTSGIGGISQALGLNAQGANINSGTNQAQLGTAYTGANNAINSQVGLTNTLNPQASTAVGNQNAVAQQEAQIAQGGGPNPAANQLAQATGQNVGQEAALLAGQRGASGNVGLAARNIGNQGANIQQNAAGQAATLESQQQIAAQQNLANLSNQQIAQAQGANTALNTAQQNEQNTLQNANTSYNNAETGMQSNINTTNAGTNKGILGGITSGLSSLTGGLLAKGGQVEPVHGKHKLDFVHKMASLGLKHYDEGGNIQPDPTPDPVIDPDKAKSAQDSMRQAFGYADGGQIKGNPLLGTMPSGQAMAQGPQYNQSQASSGPSIQAAAPDSGPSLGDQMKSGLAAGQAWKANQAAKNNPTIGETNDIQDASGTPGGAQYVGTDPNSPIDPSETDQTFTQNAYDGGEIYNVHPSEHAKYYAQHFSNYFAKGGESKKVEAMLSPGEIYLPPDAVERVKHGADPIKEGMRVPGKPKVKGDSLKNDIVPATLEEGGVVVDRKNVKSPDKARLFVLKSLKATGRHMKKPQGA